MNRLARTLAAALLAAILCWPLAAAAKDESRVYVIKRGDTLWGLSDRFVKDPYYWPNLWAHNPFITNPHLIYPGQEVHVRDGRLLILPAGTAAGMTPDAATDAVPPLPEPVEALTVKTVPGGEGFVITDGFAYDGVLVDFIDGRLLTAEGDTAFAQFKAMAQVQPGDDFGLFRKSRQIFHPHTGKPFGWLVEELGSLEVQQLDGDVATSRITRALREIKRGDLLRPIPRYPVEIELRRATKEVEAVILGSRDDRLAFGQEDIIYLDKGTGDGLAVGNLLHIIRPREATEFALNQETLVLPDRLMGAAVVVDATATTAVALVVKTVAELHAGDLVATAMP